MTVRIETTGADRLRELHDQWDDAETLAKSLEYLHGWYLAAGPTDVVRALDEEYERGRRESHGRE